LELLRGEIYYIVFPNTFDILYPSGKKKFVLVLQEGAIFKDYDAVTVLLITSDSDSKNYDTNVIIEKGTTKLAEESYIICAQPFTILKSLFEQTGVWCAGRLRPEKMNEIDEALYIGLCMGLQNESSSVEESDEKSG
jgi:mRNA-degrading endonuclease toxin of MazEF toxin-antitoxin module